MGGGNAQKSKMARERNLEKLKGGKGSQLEANKKAMNIQCKICMQTFICTTSEAKCKEHAEAKHPKSELVQCFPTSSSNICQIRGRERDKERVNPPSIIMFRNDWLLP